MENPVTTPHPVRYRLSGFSNLILTWADSSNACSIASTPASTNIDNPSRSMLQLRNPASTAESPPLDLWDTSIVSASRFSGLFRCPPISVQTGDTAVPVLTYNL